VTPALKGTCPHCGRPVKLKGAHLIATHHLNGSRCPGSGKYSASRRAER
jgi:hypothetical protein